MQQDKLRAPERHHANAAVKRSALTIQHQHCHGVCACWPDLCSVAGRGRSDKVVRICGAGCSLNGLLLRLRLAAEDDVLSDGAREQHRLLTDQADVGAQPADVQLLNVDAVKQDLRIDWF